ncbi:MAG: sugar MFS transporter [Cyclobacteriaceae bacterium]
MASSASGNNNVTVEGGGKNNSFAFGVVTFIFFMWGFLTVLNDILIPHFKELFSLSYFQSSLVQMTFFIAFFIISLPAGAIIKKIGYKNGMILGLIIAGIGAGLFYPASIIKEYSVFLGALFVLSSGITILQVAANPYVSVLGKPETAASRLNLSQALNSLGTTLGGPFGSLFILGAVATVASTSEKVKALQGPYLGLAIALVVLAFIIKFINLPTITHPSEEGNTEGFKIKNYPNLIFGIIGIFMYVGSEVCIGSYLINYMNTSANLHMEESQAGFYLSLFWGGLMIGRFAGSYLTQKFKAHKILTIFAITCVGLLVLSLLTTKLFSVICMLLTGLCLSIMFPTIFTLAIDKLGEFTSKASAFLVMAIVGGAVLPSVQGLLADSFSLKFSFIVPLLGICYIVFFALKGYKTKS